jgi:peptidyl-prolyl cis-trans isomerase D
MAEPNDPPARDGALSLRRLGVWVILVALAAVFGLTFGVPSESLTFGPQPIARVHGEPIDQSDFTYELNAVTHFVAIPEDERTQELMGLRQQVLEGVVERIVLAEAAKQVGLRAVTQDAEELTFNGNLIVLGETYPWMGRAAFNYQAFTNGLLAALGVSEQDYLEIQRQELMARTLRDVLAASTVVPEPDVREEYDRRADKLSLRYVRFSTLHFAELVDPTPTEVEAWIAAHRDELATAFQAQGARFTKLPRQVKLRYIKIVRPAGPPEGADAPTRAEHQRRLAEARERAVTAARRIGKGEEFAAVAREVSEDPTTARAGGSYGWVGIEGTGSGLDPVVDAAAGQLADGQASELLDGEDAWWLVRVDGHREGDVPEDVALRELATERLAQEHGKALAKQAAQEAQLALESGKKMSELFQAPDALGAGGEGIEELGTGSSDTRPLLRVTGLFDKEATIPGIGAVPELAKSAWDADPKAEVLGQVFEVADGWIVAGLERRETGSDEGFAAARTDLYRELAEQKARRLTSHFAHRRCLEAKGRGDISTNEPKIKALMTYDTRLGVDDQGAPVMKPYSMCERVGTRGGLLGPSMMLGGGGR